MKQSQSRLDLLQKKSKSLEQLYQTIIPQVQCPFGHELKNPVTIIPCGHNYCLGCKRGYTKDCSQCNGKLKIEAVYRNELMDDIIGMINGIKQVLEIIKWSSLCLYHPNWIVDAVLFTFTLLLEGFSSIFPNQSFSK